MRAHSSASQLSSRSLPSYHAAPWRLRDRLTTQDIADLVAAAKDGTSQKILAARYGIDVRSVRKLLREQAAGPGR